MTSFFYGLGIVIILIGAAWCVLIFGQPYSGTSMAMAGRLMAIAPGISIMGGGLLFLAIGGILGRLDKIAHSAADTADAIEDLLVHVKKGA
ncbi:hypothetical protein [Devosia sp.]|uniref:hypothetical protein n=1 Tax=Devosia sp. TaxID=1871048 RepID=UPI001AC15704|nr:hypothetical protein [Devosia sp.]MBN9335387.1 hypothetical protein [Devosia sp.]